jgi:predicted alpha/beta hydrolase family esterase
MTRKAGRGAFGTRRIVPQGSTFTFMARSFLVLHGWQNHRPVGHWHRWLVEQLRERGELAVYPQLPDPDFPDLDTWLGVVHQEWELLPAGERVVVAHSLGVSTWVHAVHRFGVRADRTLLVAPPGPTALLEHAAMNSWLQMPDGVDGSDWDLVCSDADPFCVEGTATWFGGRYRCRIHEIAGAGHLTPDDGYGPWPWALDWCLGS